MTEPPTGDPISRFIARCRDAVRWRANVLRRRVLMWRAARKASSVIARLAKMKAANSGREFVGILLIEHIGDIIACEPIVEQMKTDHPTAFLVWVVKRQYAALLQSHPRVDAVVVVNSLLSVERVVESRIFDVAVDLHVNSRPTEVRGRKYQKRSGDPAIDLETYIGKGSLLRSFSLAAGIEPRSAAPTMYVPKGAVRAIDGLSLPDNFVVVHATPNYGDKDWSASKWRDLVRHIADHYETQVIEIGLESVIELEHPRFMSLCGKSVDHRDRGAHSPSRFLCRRRQRTRAHGQRVASAWIAPLRPLLRLGHVQSVRRILSRGSGDRHSATPGPAARTTRERRHSRARSKPDVERDARPSQVRPFRLEWIERKASHHRNRVSFVIGDLKQAENGADTIASQPSTALRSRCRTEHITHGLEESHSKRRSGSRWLPSAHSFQALMNTRL